MKFKNNLKMIKDDSFLVKYLKDKDEKTVFEIYKDESRKRGQRIVKLRDKEIGFFLYSDNSNRTKGNGFYTFYDGINNRMNGLFYLSNFGSRNDQFDVDTILPIEQNTSLCDDTSQRGYFIFKDISADSNEDIITKDVIVDKKQRKVVASIPTEEMSLST